jgi:hypothetical protein
MNDDLVCALFWGTYILEMNLFDDDYKFIKKDEGDVWGILGDIDDVTEDWSWLEQANPFTDD